MITRRHMAKYTMADSNGVQVDGRTQEADSITEGANERVEPKK